MSAAIIGLIENSPLRLAIEQVERGEDVDVDRVLALQALAVARAGELYAVDILTREQASDEHYAQQIGN